MSNIDGRHARLSERDAKHGVIEADITLFSTREGGRERAIRSGYACGFSIGEPAERDVDINSADVTFDDRESIEPGVSARVRLHPRMAEAWQPVAVNAVLTMREGTRPIGRVIVVASTLR